MARASRKNVSMIKTPDPSQSSDWNFPVRQEELKTSEGVSSGIFAVIRGDTGGVVGQYRGVKVLPYADLVETFEGGLTRSGITFDRSIVTVGNGSRFFAKYDLNETLTAGNESFRGRLNLQGAYDGKLKYGFSFAAMNLMCLNGVEGMTKLMELYKKVSSNNNVSLLANDIGGVIQSGTLQITETIEKMSQIEINDNDARHILTNLTTKGAVAGVSPKAGHLIYDNWCNPDDHEKTLGLTFNRLYNAATRFTRDIEKVGRFEMSKKASRYIGGAFHLATKREDVLASLLAKPANVLDFDGVTVNN